MKKYFLITWIIAFFVITQFGANNQKTALDIKEIPNDFVYDGCSMFPDGNYWDCCKTHDDSYFFGGTWQQRLQADNELYSCVQAKWWFHYLLAPTMWLGVRIWWAPIFPSSFRWWFGRNIY